MNSYKRHVLIYKFIKKVASKKFIKMFNYQFEAACIDNTPFILLANHNTNYDPILVSIAIDKHLYYVTSEHIYRWGFPSFLIKHFLAPIARTKGATDSRTVKEIIRHLRAGHNVGIFPEGNCSFNGMAYPIPASTGKLVKTTGASLVTFKFEGGYFSAPRWGVGIRRGQLRGAVVRNYAPDKLKTMSADEIQAVIRRDLYEDAYATQAKTPVQYAGRDMVVGLETVLFTCPKCRSIGRLRGIGNTLQCVCGYATEYNEYGRLCSNDEHFTTITEWDDWQQKELKLSAHNEGFSIRDERQRLYAIKPAKSTRLLYEGKFTLDANGIKMNDFMLPMDEIADMAVYGRANLVFSSINGEHYELRSDEFRSAYKYLKLFEIYKGKW